MIASRYLFLFFFLPAALAESCLARTVIEKRLKQKYITFDFIFTKKAAEKPLPSANSGNNDCCGNMISNGRLPSVAKSRVRQWFFICPKSRTKRNQKTRIGDGSKYA